MKVTTIFFLLSSACCLKADAQHAMNNIKRANADKNASTTNQPIFKPAIITDDAIDTFNVKTGFLKFYNKRVRGKISFYYYTNDTYEFYGDLVITDKNVNQRVVLQVGKYEIKYGVNNTSRQFTILSKMITEIGF